MLVSTNDNDNKQLHPDHEVYLAQRSWLSFFAKNHDEMRADCRSFADLKTISMVANQL